MYLGAHVSIAGGFDKCIDRIVDIGGNCLMTFASSPRSMQYSELNPEALDLYRKKKITSKIGSHFFHAPYLINLATVNDDHLEASIKLLTFYQDTSDLIGGSGTIFHIGSAKEANEATLKQIADCLIKMQSTSGRKVPIILENAAGQGGAIGKTFGQIAQIIEYCALNIEHLGVCLDTQHLFASGYNLDTVLDEFEKIVGLKYLKVIHLNDSKTEFNSFVDRHENLGEGKIGEQVLQKFINNPRLKTIPFILEVPGDGKSGPRKIDIDKLQSLVLQ